jgi:putative restriction endonuclease
MSLPGKRRTIVVVVDELDAAVRSAAFNFLREKTLVHGEVLSRQILAEGFAFRYRRVPLIGPQGIFKPAVLSLPLSITTVPEVEGKPRPYDDSIGLGGEILYRYRGTDPAHPDNVGLRTLMRDQKPLIYLRGIVQGRYLPAWPAYIVGDNPVTLTFTIQVDEPMALPDPSLPIDRVAERRYATRQVMQRVHQQAFRERVIRAYETMCSICRLRHRELLDAAHILPDGHPRGQPVVPNGLALCKLHHAAFDSNLVGVRPDLVLVVSRNVLEEGDGPMLLHGLQEIHGQRLIVPRSLELRPSPDRLEERYETFKKAG